VQEPNNVAMKTVGAIAAAQIALMPLAGAHQHVVARPVQYPQDRSACGFQRERL
jgi:hypothetical protein